MPVTIFFGDLLCFFKFYTIPKRNIVSLFSYGYFFYFYKNFFIILFIFLFLYVIHIY